MLTRRKVVLAGVAAAAVSAVGPDALAAPPLPGRTTRRLELRISDGFASQTWTAGGRSWIETKKRLDLVAGETVEVVIRNDSAQDRFITWGEDIMCRLVRAGGTTTLTFHVTVKGKFGVGVLSDNGVTADLPADVRPS